MIDDDTTILPYIAFAFLPIYSHLPTLHGSCLTCLFASFPTIYV